MDNTSNSASWKHPASSPSVVDTNLPPGGCQWCSSFTTHLVTLQNSKFLNCAWLELKVLKPDSDIIILSWEMMMILRWFPLLEIQSWCFQVWEAVNDPGSRYLESSRCLAWNLPLGALTGTRNTSSFSCLHRLGLGALAEHWHQYADGWVRRWVLLVNILDVKPQRVVETKESRSFFTPFIDMPTARKTPSFYLCTIQGISILQVFQNLLSQRHARYLWVRSSKLELVWKSKNSSQDARRFKRPSPI